MKVAERTKVVVRRLPPYLKEEEFKNEVDKVAEGTYGWYRFCQGKISSKRTTYSRGYLNFNDAKSVLDFKSKFDGFVFVGSRGTQYKCVIEYAPYQRIAKQKSKPDRREGTLEQDPDYLKFVENLDKSPVMLPSAQRQFEEEEAQRLAAGEGNDGIIMTPLMECIVKKYLNKAASKSNARRESRSKDSRNQRSSHSKSNSMKTSPTVLLRTRPSSQGSDSNEKGKNKQNLSLPRGKSRKNVKVREGHQAYVPKSMRSNNDPQENSGSGTSSEQTKTSSETPERSKREMDEGRGRGRRRGGRGHHYKPQQKVMWVPKTDKKGEE